MNPMLVFFEPSDVARLLGLTPGAVHLLIRARRLTPIAKTPRGVHLFLPADIEKLRQAREAKKTPRQLARGPVGRGGE